MVILAIFETTTGTWRAEFQDHSGAIGYGATIVEAIGTLILCDGRLKGVEVSTRTHTKIG